MVEKRGKGRKMMETSGKEFFSDGAMDVLAWTFIDNSASRWGTNGTMTAEDSDPDSIRKRRGSGTIEF